MISLKYSKISSMLRRMASNLMMILFPKLLIISIPCLISFLLCYNMILKRELVLRFYF